MSRWTSRSVPSGVSHDSGKPGYCSLDNVVCEVTTGSDSTAKSMPQSHTNESEHCLREEQRSEKILSKPEAPKFLSENSNARHLWTQGPARRRIVARSTQRRTASSTFKCAHHDMGNSDTISVWTGCSAKYSICSRLALHKGVQYPGLPPS